MSAECPLAASARRGERSSFLRPRLLRSTLTRHSTAAATLIRDSVDVGARKRFLQLAADAAERAPSGIPGRRRPQRAACAATRRRRRRDVDADRRHGPMQRAGAVARQHDDRHDVMARAVEHLRIADRSAGPPTTPRLATRHALSPVSDLVSPRFTCSPLGSCPGSSARDDEVHGPAHDRRRGERRAHDLRRFARRHRRRLRPARCSPR